MIEKPPEPEPDPVDVMPPPERLIELYSGADRPTISETVAILDAYADAMGIVERFAELKKSEADLLARVAGLKSQLPRNMEHCVILYKTCGKGHGWLTAANWIDHGCPTCAIELAGTAHDAEAEALARSSRKEIEVLRAEKEHLREAWKRVEGERDHLHKRWTEAMLCASQNRDRFQKVQDEKTELESRLSGIREAMKSLPDRYLIVWGENWMRSESVSHWLQQEIRKIDPTL